MHAIVSFLFAIIVADFAPAGPSQTFASWSVSQRQQALSRAEAALNTYFYPDKIAELKAAIEANRQSLLAIADQKAFATTLTHELQAVSGDKHLIVWYSNEPSGHRSATKDYANAELQKFFQHIGYGVNSTIRLTGNIGYLNVGGFANMPKPKRTLDAAMTLIFPTDALIIDLRGNAGGDSDTVAYLLGYFFSRPTEITGAVVRIKGGFRTDRDFTPAAVGGPRYLKKPVYVLIDHHTLSGGEMFAYDLQALHRGTVLGEPSAGAAMGLGSPPFFLTEHLTISVPNAQTKNPYTGSNWEGTGVIPDVASKRPLLDAYQRALHAASDAYDPLNELPGALEDPATALRASLPAISP